MSNLLEKASILTTPTAYDNGKILSVKPNTSAGDFDFTRNSSATRVNAQGLVEDVQILSSNLVQNGDFSQEGAELITNGDFATNSDWILGSGWSIGGGKAVAINSASGQKLRQMGQLTPSKTYKLVYEVTEITLGGFRPIVGAVAGTAVYSIGTYTEYITTINDDFYIRTLGTTSGSIDNVSVKEVGQDWTLGTNITIGENKAIFTSTASGQSVSQNAVASSLTNGALAKVSFEVLTRTEGSFGVYFSGTLVGTLASAGVFTAYFTKGTETSFYIRALGTTSGSISNISVIEITDDTNLPRIDYTDGVGSWLFEPQSTNLITYSEDFSNSFYVKDSGVSVGTTNNLSPSINANATKIDVTNNGRIYANIATNTYYTTVFIKSGTFSHFKLAGSNIDLIAETNSNGTIQSFGNGWYRIGKSYTGNRPFQIQAYPDGTYSNHTTSGNYFIWGAQSEVQSFATSYIPTNGEVGGVTRLQDASFGAGSSDLINSTEGVLYAEISALANYNAQRWIGLSDGTHNNTVKIGVLNSTSEYKIACEVRVGGVNQVFMTNNFGAVQPTFKKCAVKYKQNDFALWIDGVKVATDTIGNVPTGLNKLSFDRGDGGQDFFGKTKCVSVFKEALTDEELTCLTTI